MYIEPNTHIQFLKNVPLDNSYKNTIYFEDKFEQYNYFSNFVKHTLTKQTYQRVSKGVARVQIKAENLYDCNYMMFKNVDFYDQWFYAFITGVEYVNNNVSEITFEIDVLQTWLLQCEFKECFVEREHSETDVPGDNTQPEKIEHGEYISSSFAGTGKLSDCKIVVASTLDELSRDTHGGLYGGIYSGLYLTVWNNWAEVNSYLDTATEKNKADSIVSVFMMPSAFVTGRDENCKSYTLNFDKQYNKIDKYEPRNKKLLSYPYNFLYVTNLEGQSAIYQYELFSTDNCTFTMCGDFSCSPSIVLYPNNYKGVTANIDEKISMTGFPQCSYNIDTYKAWLAQKGPGFLGGLVADTVRTMVNFAINPGIGVATGVSAVTNAVSQIYEHSTQPPQAKGGNSSDALFALKMKDFAFMYKHIKKEYACVIDEYFDMYGYATNRIKIPNRSKRPCWNFVKTIGCTIVGGAPADDIAKMCNIHDNGITYWKPTAVFGCYNPEVQDNSV